MLLACSYIQKAIVKAELINVQRQINRVMSFTDQFDTRCKGISVGQMLVDIPCMQELPDFTIYYRRSEFKHGRKFMNCAISEGCATFYTLSSEKQYQKGLNYIEIKI